MTASPTDDLASAERRIQELTKELSQASGELAGGREQLAVTAAVNTRRFEEVQTRNTELRTALDQQMATSEVLRVIGSSPTDLQCIFDTIVENAKRLLNGHSAGLEIIVGEEAHFAALTMTGEPGDDTLKELRSRPRTLASAPLLARMVRDLAPYFVSDIETDRRITPLIREMARIRGSRSLLTVPMVRQGQAIGAISVTRRDVGIFADEEIALIKTFADQAVIAIENTRLFEEVQARTKELQDSLDRQTATSEVLGVISRSPNEVQPVLDTIMATAQRLCQAERGAIWLLKGETFRVVAHHGQPEALVGSIYSARPPVSRVNMLGRATLARRAVQVEDVATDPELSAESHAFYRAANVHTILAVPLLLKDHPIGVITLARTRVAPFDDKQVALVEAFADQAVIAIENSRLFEAEQASKRELQESLEYQTATGEVLNVISRSPTDVQPVFDMIAESAWWLCEAQYC